MKAEIHPTWYPEASVSCLSCGKTWKTGATVPTLTTEICSNCHPFYTGEQRIVDTEGRVDSFLRRLQRRDDMRAAQQAARAALTPLDLPLSKLGISKRHQTLLEENGMKVVQDFLDRLSEGGDEGILGIAGLGRQALSDIKKSLRSRGYNVPSREAEGE
ncbi:MAG: 50S ribosomal protein L31 [Anaerolineae bacterium]|nr:50S ribosomal protein L31 [Anaerolineae bacterium]